MGWNTGYSLPIAPATKAKECTQQLLFGELILLVLTLLDIATDTFSIELKPVPLTETAQCPRSCLKFLGNINSRSFIGGSDARIIMGSDEPAPIRLWREKRGEAEPEDLSGNLIVQLGTATEELNRNWYARNQWPDHQMTSSAG